MFKQPNVDQLEKVVNEAKILHVEAKRKAKGLASEGATPNSRPGKAPYTVYHWRNSYIVSSFNLLHQRMARKDMSFELLK